MAYQYFCTEYHIPKSRASAILIIFFTDDELVSSEAHWSDT